MHRSRSRFRLILAAAGGCVAAALGTACQDPVRSPSASGHGSATHVSTRAVSGDVQRDIARLRALTAPFHRFEAAMAAGWSTQITGCLSDPVLGGMGYHYGNVGLIDGTVNVLEPELLLYEPRKNGELRLVAVEYIVPFDAWTAQEPPELFGQAFHRNEAFGIWALHVWHFRHNPRGMFADWNPNVTCDHAGP